MINEVEKQRILIEEQQLGTRLNSSIHQGNRADFSLLLAMLVDDVRFQSQFNLPHQDHLLAVNKSSSLRQYFDLPEEAPLALKNVSQITKFNQAERIVEHDMDTIRLINVLDPKPLAFRDDKNHIPANIMSNTSIHCQHKSKVESKPKRNSFDAASWLKVIETTLVKAATLDMSA